MSSKLFSCKEEGKANAFLLTSTLEFNDSRALSGVQNGGRAPKTLVQQVHHPAVVSIACW